MLYERIRILVASPLVLQASPLSLLPEINLLYNSRKEKLENEAVSISQLRFEDVAVSEQGSTEIKVHLWLSAINEDMANNYLRGLVRNEITKTCSIVVFDQNVYGSHVLGKATFGQSIFGAS